MLGALIIRATRCLLQLSPAARHVEEAAHHGRIKLSTMGFDEGVLQSDMLRSALIPHRPSQVSTITLKVSVKVWEVQYLLLQPMQDDPELVGMSAGSMELARGIEPPTCGLQMETVEEMKGSVFQMVSPLCV